MTVKTDPRHGRHANPGESFGCMFCGKHLSSRSSLQVHISQVHREQQKVRETSRF